jgi:hypothetical protein
LLLPQVEFSEKETEYRVVVGGYRLANRKSMSRRLAVFSLLFWACEGLVGEPGVYGPPTAAVEPQSAVNGPSVIAFSCDATSVKTRIPVSCLIQARQPEGGSVRCELDLGTGTSVQQLGSCEAPQRASLIFSDPGLIKVTLRATDEQSRVTLRTMMMEVTGKPNEAPVLSDFKATPPRGGAPLKSTLTWSAMDPEGDSLKCFLEVDGAPVSCSASPHALQIAALGTHVVKLTLADTAGRTAEGSLTLEVLRPTGDVILSAVDFGQTVMKETLTLVEGKSALLRVTVLANAAGLTTAVEVEARNGAMVLGKKRLEGPATLPLTATPGDLTKSFRMMLPEEWVQPGVSFVIRVDPDALLPETDESNNDRTVTPTIGRGNILHLTSVPIVQGGMTGEVKDLEAIVTGLWPLKHVEAKTRAPYTFSGDLTGTSPSAWSALLSALSQVRAADGSARYYYGWAKVSYRSGVAGVGIVGGGVATGRDDSIQTAAHELGHNFGRQHSPCGMVAGADPAYPYPGARLGSWGFDGTKLLAPDSFVDLMSYCSPEWVSDYTYERAQQFMDGKQVFDPTAVLPYVRPVDALLLGGRVTSEEIQLFPLHRVRAAPSAPVKSDTQLELVTITGHSVRVPVELAAAGEDDALHFVAVVPDPGALTKVRLAWRGLVASSEAPPVPLEVTSKVTRVDAQTVRVRWSGAPWAAVAHLGDERTTLALQATGGEVLVRHDGLRGGSMEVSLSDGVRSQRLVIPLPD